jgi:hypothetical protein
MDTATLAASKDNYSGALTLAQIKRRLAFALLLFLVGTATFAATQAHELCDFILKQDSSAFDHGLGKPFRTESLPDKSVMRAYMLPGTQKTYLVAIFKQGRAVRLELTGEDFTGPTGFFGLTLGENSSAVKKVLGEPSNIRHEAESNLDLWDYYPSNYSLEFATDHRLYSIQVNEDPPSKPPLVVGTQAVRKFALAIQTNDLDTVVQMSSGALECTDKSALSFARAARIDLADSHGELARCLKKATEAIVSLGEKMPGTDDQLRIAERGGPFCVTKFPASSLLKEVVFTREVDDWRVYEVTLR